MSIRKKIVSAILAGVLCVTTAASLTGCGDVSYAMTINDEKLNAGIYLYYEYQAKSEAVSKFAEENPDVDTSAEGFDYFANNVEGRPFAQWITDKTEELCKEYAAVNALFDEKGLELTEDEISEINASVKSTWYDENPYLVYYGIDFDTMGKYYESLGIGMESYKQLALNEEKRETLFDSLYSVGGTEGTTQAEVDAYFAENYARAAYFEIALEDGNGDTIETSEGLQILEDLGNGYVEELKNGTPFSTVSKEYDTFVDEQRKAAEKAQAEADGTVYLEEDEEEEADEDKTEADYETMFTKTGTYPSEEFVENLFAMSNDAPQLYKTEDAYYVVVRRDLSERTDWLEENTHTIIHKLKEDAMTELLANAYAGYNVVINEAAKSAYDPKSLK
ncbi:MAG: hypothetical protein ACI4J1_01980 [Ruminiclostridium sp.]